MNTKEITLKVDKSDPYNCKLITSTGVFHFKYGDELSEFLATVEEPQPYSTDSAGEEVYVVVTEPETVYVEGSFTVKFPDMTIRRLKRTTLPTVSEEEIRDMAMKSSNISCGNMGESIFDVHRKAFIKGAKAIKELLNR